MIENTEILELGKDSFQPPATFKIPMLPVPIWKIRSIANYKRVKSMNATMENKCDNSDKPSNSNKDGEDQATQQATGEKSSNTELETVLPDSNELLSSTNTVSAGLGGSRRKSKMKALGLGVARAAGCQLDSPSSAENQSLTTKAAAQGNSSSSTSSSNAIMSGDGTGLNSSVNNSVIPSTSGASAVSDTIPSLQPHAFVSKEEAIRHFEDLNKKMSIVKNEMIAFEKTRQTLVWLLEKSTQFETQRNHVRGSTRSTKIEEFRPKKRTRLIEAAEEI